MGYTSGSHHPKRAPLTSAALRVFCSNNACAVSVNDGNETHLSTVTCNCRSHHVSVVGLACVFNTSLKSGSRESDAAAPRAPRGPAGSQRRGRHRACTVFVMHDHVRRCSGSTFHALTVALCLCPKRKGQHNRLLVPLIHVVWFCTFDVLNMASLSSASRSPRT